MSSLQKILVTFLFFLSGFAGLVYQNLWVRLLGLTVGSSSLALSIVLAIFFAGLALGSFLAARVAGRITNPLRVYAWIELGVGAYAILLAEILFVLPSFAALLAGVPGVGASLPFITVTILLLPPTIAMGATLPILLRIFARDDARVGRDLGSLYGLNTLGAAVGALLCGFLLVPKLGVSGANLLAVGLNFLAGIIALVILRKWPGAWCFPPQHDEAFRFSFQFGAPLSRFEKSTLLVLGLVGFASISLEVVWSKYLGIFFGTNIYGLSLTLSIVLSGIALGAILFAPLVDRSRNREILFTLLVILTSFLLLKSTQLLGMAPEASDWLWFIIGNKIPLLWAKAIVVAFILLPPTILLGAILPAGIRILSHRARYAPETSGAAYAINTLGAIVGAFLTGTILIPHFGSSFTVNIAILILLGAVLLLLLTMKSFLLHRVAGFLLCAILVVTLVRSKEIDYTQILRTAYLQYSDGSKKLAPESEVFEAIFEGENAIISLSRDQENPEYLWMKTNGLNESYFDEDPSGRLPKYEALLAFLPYALRPEAKSAFIVGYGGGYSVDLLTSTGIEDVVVAEIEPAIMKAVDFVYHGKNPLLSRKNLKVEIADARRALAREQRKYDIIISQPSHSWLSGTANLFTLEFFQLVRDRLSSKGVYSQWMNLYNTDSATLKSILKTFFTVFPHGAVFTDINDSEMILLGSVTESRFSLDTLTLLARDPALKQRLAEIPFEDAYDFFPLFQLGRDEALAAAIGAPLNTDRNAYAETRQSRLFYSAQDNETSEWLAKLYSGTFRGLLEGEGEAMADFLARTIRSLQKKSNNFYKFHALFNRLERLAKGTATDYLILGNLSYKMERYASAIQYFEKSFSLSPDAESMNSLLGAYVAVEKFDEAEKLFTQHRKLANRTSDCYDLSLRLARKSNSAVELAAKLEDDLERYQGVCGNYLERLLGDFHFQAGRFRKAIDFYEAYAETADSDIDVLGKRIAAHLIMGDRDSASQLMHEFADLQVEESDRLVKVASFYRERGLLKDADVLSARANRIAGAAHP